MNKEVKIKLLFAKYDSARDRLKKDYYYALMKAGSKKRFDAMVRKFEAEKEEITQKLSISKRRFLYEYF